jgi:hypothetical protein
MPVAGAGGGVGLGTGFGVCFGTGLCVAGGLDPPEVVPGPGGRSGAWVPVRVDVVPVDVVPVDVVPVDVFPVDVVRVGVAERPAVGEAAGAERETVGTTGVTGAWAAVP